MPVKLISVQAVHVRSGEQVLQVSAKFDDQRFAVLMHRRLHSVAIGSGLFEHENLRGEERVASWTDGVARRLVLDGSLGWAELRDLERAVRERRLRDDPPSLPVSRSLLARSLVRASNAA